MSGQFAALSIAPMLFLAQLPFQGGTQPDKNQQLAMYSKPAVVRVIAGCQGTYIYKDTSYAFISGGIGTGYFIDPNGFVVTNAHVVNFAEGGKDACEDRLFDNLIEKLTGEKDAKNVSQERKDDIRSNSRLEAPVVYRNHVILSDGKQLPFDFKERGFTTIDEAEQNFGKDVAVIKIEVTDAPILKLGDSTTVQIQDSVMVLGYPGAADNFSALSSESLLQATVLNGSVTNTNKILQNGARVLQINVPVSPGSSGSPILNQNGEVIGMITFRGEGRDEETNFPYAVPSSKILEYAPKSGAVNEEGPGGLLYREGLDLFWKGDFEGAKKKFEAVQKLFPQHSEIPRLLKDTEQEIAQTFQNRSYLPLLAGVGVAIAGLLGAYFIVRRRPAPAVADGFGDTGISDRSIADPAPNSRQPMTLVSQQRQPSTAVTTQSYLELKNAQGNSRIFYLRSSSHRLGRDRVWADFKVPDEGWEVISKHHATLRKEQDGYRIYDGDGIQRSTNGVLINGVLIPLEGHLLKNGDELQIGHDPHNQVRVAYVAPGSDRAVLPSETNSKGA